MKEMVGNEKRSFHVMAYCCICTIATGVAAHGSRNFLRMDYPQPHRIPYDLKVCFYFPLSLSLDVSTCGTKLRLLIESFGVATLQQRVSNARTTWRVRMASLIFFE